MEIGVNRIFEHVDMESVGERVTKLKLLASQMKIVSGKFLEPFRLRHMAFTKHDVASFV